MRKCHALCLAALAALLTGCPHNQYVVELTPHGQRMERKLVFYCEDGVDTNGTPNYQSFAKDELRAINRFYLPGELKKEGERHTATGEFAGAMPDDVGGAGSYTFLTNSLGSTAFYMERFRGNDDIAERVQVHLKAADKLVDHVIGWSRQEFGGERHYQDLRRFLDGEFRQDVRNYSLHGWMIGTSLATGSTTPEEFAIRFAQYLIERGYFRVQDAPILARGFTADDSQPILRVVQQLVARKLKVPAWKPMPPALAFLTDPDKLNKSWDDYLATTAEYRAKLRHWQMKKMSAEAGVLGQKISGYFHGRSRTNAPAAPSIPDKPEPSEVADELFGQLLGDDFWGSSDHLVVRLRLKAVPMHMNGKWDDAKKEVVWESDLSARERTNSVRLPTFCYANWSEPDEQFQKAHFGRTVLKGDELFQYCLWRGGLDEKHGREWDALVASLQPGDALPGKLATFRFSDEPPPTAQKSQPQGARPADFAVQLLKSALEKQTVAEKK